MIDLFSYVVVVACQAFTSWLFIGAFLTGCSGCGTVRKVIRRLGIVLFLAGIWTMLGLNVANVVNIAHQGRPYFSGYYGDYWNEQVVFWQFAAWAVIVVGLVVVAGTLTKEKHAEAQS